MPHGYPNSLVFLELVAGYVICVLIAVIGLVVVWKLATGQIDLSALLNEKDGKGGASMARFQLLVFIFVIALCFFLVVISNLKLIQYRAGDRGLPKLPWAIPDVPNGVLLLLGISTSGYAVGKAIQHGAGTATDDDTDKKKPHVG